MPHVCGEHLVFCMGEEANVTYPSASHGRTGTARIVPWVPHIATLRSGLVSGVRRLRLGANVRVCSPILETGNGWTSLTYVMEQPLGKLRLYLRECFNVDGLDSAPATVLVDRPLFCGCRWMGKVVWSDGGNSFHVGADEYELSVTAIVRTCPYEGGLLVTVQRTDGTYATLSFDGSRLSEVCLSDGTSPYKCCVTGKSVIYAKRGEGFEDRTLHLEGWWSTRPTSISIHRL